jgi:hypothetical protein
MTPGEEGGPPVYNEKSSMKKADNMGKRVMSLRLIPLAAAMCLALSACFQADVLVRVRPEGSGTVEETFMVRKNIIREMGEAPEGMNGREPGYSGNTPGVLDEERLREKARRMGKGVRYVRAVPHETEEFAGYRVVYAFDDINALTLNENPSENLPSLRGETREELVTFRFSKGPPPVLVVRMPSGMEGLRGGEPGEAPGKRPGNGEAEGMRMGLLKGMRMGLHVEVIGKIVKTNASYVEGSRVSLMDMDFSGLLENESALDAFRETDPKTVEEAKRLMKKLLGLRIEVEEEIEIVFEDAI